MNYFFSFGNALSITPFSVENVFILFWYYPGPKDNEFFLYSLLVRLNLNPLELILLF